MARLVALKTRSFAPNSIADLPFHSSESDSHQKDELEITRDRSLNRQLRLKRSLKVSKLHAKIVFAAGCWSIWDCGSVWGTFVNGIRISPQRVKSTIGYVLSHLDTLSFGGDEEELFLVHLHPPCIECTPSFSRLLICTKPQRQPDPRIGLTNHSSTSDSGGIPFDYQQDTRHKISIKLNPPTNKISVLEDSKSDQEDFEGYSRHSLRSKAIKPVVQLRYHSIRNKVEVDQVSKIEPIKSSKPQVAKSDYSIPLNESNIGHRMLSKMGWVPGTPLGSNNISTLNDLATPQPRLIEPLRIEKRVGRKGL